MKNKLKNYKCTQCGGDATVAMSGWEDNTGKILIKKGERLCMKCSNVRTGINFFAQKGK